MPESPKWPLSFRFRFLYEFLYLPHVPPAPSTSSNIRSGAQTCSPTTTVTLCLLHFYLSHACQSPVNIYREAQIMLFLKQFSPTSCHFELPPPAPCSQHPNPFQQHTNFHTHACFSIISVQLETLTASWKHSQPVRCTARFRIFRPSPTNVYNLSNFGSLRCPKYSSVCRYKRPFSECSRWKVRHIDDLMTLKGCHQWQYSHAVFHETSQYESVKADCCGWIGLQRDRSGSLVMVQEHIHLYIKTSYYALPDVNMPFLKQRTLSQFAHSNYYCRWSLTNSDSRTRTFTTSSNKSYHYTPTRASPITWSILMLS